MQSCRPESGERAVGQSQGVGEENVATATSPAPISDLHIPRSMLDDRASIVRSVIPYKTMSGKNEIRNITNGSVFLIFNDHEKT